MRRRGESRILKVDVNNIHCVSAARVGSVIETTVEEVSPLLLQYVYFLPVCVSLRHIPSSYSHIPRIKTREHNHHATPTQSLLRLINKDTSSDESEEEKGRETQPKERK